MDIRSPHDKEKSKALSGGSMHSLDGNYGENLSIMDMSGNDTYDVDVGLVEEGFKDLKLDDAKPCQKSLCKYATFPITAKMTSSTTRVNEHNEFDGKKTGLQENVSDDSVHSPCTRSISLPTPLKLVSALKGSRERQGGSPRKLNVKWAPDVYDPPPSIVSHTVNRSKKQQKSREDRNHKQKKGKKGRKGSSSHTSSKDKKQFRKSGGSSDKCFKSMSACNRVVQLPDGLNDFEVAGPDTCGSSFLKESLGKVHYSVAEAL